MHSTVLRLTSILKTLSAERGSAVLSSLSLIHICTKTIKKTEPTVAYKIDADKHIFQVVREGMIMVADDVQWPMGSGITQLADLPYGVAIKTGTPQVTTDTVSYTHLKM